MNIKQLYEDYGVAYYESGKNVSPGWINIKCCWCDDQSNHLGFSPSGLFVCWRCGFHPTFQTLSRILNVSETTIGEIAKRYGGKVLVERAQRDLSTNTHELPSGIGPLEKQHKAYLTSRKFDPDQLEKEWGLLGTGPISRLDGTSYKHRIVAPISWDGRQVSFQARDITNHHQLRYISCPKSRELVHHKHILYGQQENWGDVGICVEGITDVWRLGPSAFATFGIEFTANQVFHMASAFEWVVILFDEEVQAQAQAEKLAASLRFRAVRVKIHKIVGDPGDLDQEEANHLVKELTKRWK